MESLFWGTSEASQQGLHILSMLLDYHSAHSVASPATNVGIFLYKGVRFGLIAVVQSASILQIFSRWLLLIILEVPNCPPR